MNGMWCRIVQTYDPWICPLKSSQAKSWIRELSDSEILMPWTASNQGQASCLVEAFRENVDYAYQLNPGELFKDYFSAFLSLISRSLVLLLILHLGVFSLPLPFLSLSFPSSI